MQFLILPTRSGEDREIFMYDVPTQTVSKLSGELSSAFVEAAESNTKGKRETVTISEGESNIIETKVPKPDTYSSRIDAEPTFSEDLSSAASELSESRIPIIDPMASDLETEASEQLESFVDISGLPIHPQGDLNVAENSVEAHVDMNSGYSKTSAK